MCVSKRNEISIEKKYLYAQICCRTTQLIQNIKSAYLSTESLMDKENVVYTQIKVLFMTNILQFATKWMELKDIILNNKARHQKTGFACFLLYVKTKNLS